MKREGLSIGDNQMILLRKIEELTLDAIEQNKQIQKLQNIVEEQNKKIELQSKAIEELETNSKKTRNK